MCCTKGVHFHTPVHVPDSVALSFLPPRFFVTPASGAASPLTAGSNTAVDFLGGDSVPGAAEPCPVAAAAAAVAAVCLVEVTLRRFTGALALGANASSSEFNLASTAPTNGPASAALAIFFFFVATFRAGLAVGDLPIREIRYTDERAGEQEKRW